MHKYKVGDHVFNTKEEIRSHISRIVSVPAGSRLSSSDETFVLELLRLRTAKLLEIGERQIVLIVVDYQAEEPQWTKCVWLVLSDGTRLDVSLYKAVRAIKPADHLMIGR